MTREITQRELRNDSGETMRALDRGEAFVVTRNGVAAGELTPLRRRRFVAADVVRRRSATRRASTSTSCARTWMPPSTRTHRRVAERYLRGLADTSVVIDLPDIDAERLPVELAVSALTLAELAAGPHATTDPDERARRQERLQRLEATFDPVPFDATAARSYGRVYAAVLAGGRNARGRRAFDLMIAATAVAVDLHCSRATRMTLPDPLTS